MFKFHMSTATQKTTEINISKMTEFCSNVSSLAIRFLIFFNLKATKSAGSKACSKQELSEHRSF